ncbi:MAG: protease pro-enzyme activation domain-containing protein, partial [Solirubrobacteraceae bacterium]
MWGARGILGVVVGGLVVGGLGLGGPAQAEAVASIGRRSLNPATTMHVTVTLRPRDPVALAAYAAAVSTPGSPKFRRYLTPAQFARRFGATRRELAVVRESLRSRGLAPGAASAGRLSIPLTAT